MKKIAKCIIGSILFLLFFLFIDPSGIGFKSNMIRIRKWAEKNSNFVK